MSSDSKDMFKRMETVEMLCMTNSQITGQMSNKFGRLEESVNKISTNLDTLPAKINGNTEESLQNNRMGKETNTDDWQKNSER